MMLHSVGMPFHLRQKNVSYQLTDSIFRKEIAHDRKRRTQQLLGSAFSWENMDFHGFIYNHSATNAASVCNGLRNPAAAHPHLRSD